MLKITHSKEDAKTVNLKLEGKISSRWVEELKRKCEEVLANGSNLVLDLSGVTFVDEGGVRALKELRAGQVGLKGCSLYISGLL